MELIVIRPDEFERGSAYRFSDRIINGLRKEKEISVVGSGNAIALACMAVQLASSIARVSIKEISLDYIGAPALGIGGIVIILGKELEGDWEQRKKQLDAIMKLEFSPDGQLIVISKNLSPDQLIPMSLSKLSKSEYLKIVATGTAINRAALVALELARGDIAREPIGIELVTLSTFQFKTEAKPSQGTAIEIYLKKGAPTTYSSKHNAVLKMLEQR